MSICPFYFISGQKTFKIYNINSKVALIKYESVYSHERRFFAKGAFNFDLTSSKLLSFRSSIYIFQLITSHSFKYLSWLMTVGETMVP